MICTFLLSTKFVSTSNAWIIRLIWSFKSRKPYLKPKSAVLVLSGTSIRSYLYVHWKYTVWKIYRNFLWQGSWSLIYMLCEDGTTSIQRVTGTQTERQTDQMYSAYKDGQTGRQAGRHNWKLNERGSRLDACFISCDSSNIFSVTKLVILLTSLIFYSLDPFNL